MDLLLVPVPLFDKYMTVEAYLLRYKQVEQGGTAALPNDFLLMEALAASSVEAFTGGRPILVPIRGEVLGRVAGQCRQPPELTTFFLEDLVAPTPEQLEQIQYLKEKGYRFAVPHIDRFVDSEQLLALADYVILSDKAMHHSDRKAMVVRYGRMYRHLQVVATKLDDAQAFERALAEGFQLFEGKFYRIPVSRSDREFTPIKSNLIRLLNLVRSEDFEFKDIAEVMRRDPALSYSLMRFVNSPYLGVRHKIKSIQHAVTILGQQEVRKWVTAAVFKSLGADRPSELTRISLVRGKFSENIAESYGLAEASPSLFLMGLFSVLDTMLDTSMAHALSQVLVTDEISEALLDGTGVYAPVLQLVVDYERADWAAVQNHCAQHEIAISTLYRAYLDAVSWYNELLTDKVKFRR